MGTLQNIVLRQEAKYDGNDWQNFSRAGRSMDPDQQDGSSADESWWEWSIWVDGPESELDQIEYVEYTLDPSFPNPVRKLRNRSQKFRLSTGGWGTFTIYAKAVAFDGSTLSLKHDLVLFFPDGGRPTDPQS
jgi:hypothetical protein